jgi:hypothetical protein
MHLLQMRRIQALFCKRDWEQVRITVVYSSMPTEQKVMPFDVEDGVDRRRDRTCNLLIRSQAPCHWASRPVIYGMVVGQTYIYQDRISTN